MTVSKKVLSLPVFAGVFVCLSIIAYFTLENLLIKIGHNYLKFTKDSLATKWYKDLPIDLINRFYFYNVTNADEIINNGAKPNLKEIGPFVYKLYFNKTDMKFNGNDTISFYEKRTWYFDLDASAYGDDIKLVTINAPMVTALTLVDNVPNPLRYLLKHLIESISHKLFIERSIRELLFDGYPDAFASLGPLIDPSLRKNKGKFGYMWPRNASTDVYYTVFAGDDVSKFNLIDKLDGKPMLTTWLTDDCNRINDTTNGEARPSLLQHPQKSIKFYHPLICRPVTFNFTRAVVTKDGFNAYNFKVDMNMYRNKSDYPPNACFDSKIVKKHYVSEEYDGTSNSLLYAFIDALLVSPTIQKETKQFPSGVMDLSKCFFGAPVLMSLPHFLHADPYYLRSVDGMKPNEDVHEFWLDVEPITGISMDTAIRFQVNFYINKPKDIRKYEKVPEVAFPVFWQEIVIKWPDNFARKIRTLFYLLHSASYITFGVCLSIGSLLIIIFLYKIMNWKRTRTMIVTTRSEEDLRRIVAKKVDANENKLGIDNPTM